MVAIFIRRPIATTLLAIGLALAGLGRLVPAAGGAAAQYRPAHHLVSASMAGAAPEVMSNTVATPLERHLGSIAGVTEMTSSSNTGSTPGDSAVRHQPRH